MNLTANESRHSVSNPEARKGKWWIWDSDHNFICFAVMAKVFRGGVQKDERSDKNGGSFKVYPLVAHLGSHSQLCLDEAYEVRNEDLIKQLS